MFFYANWNLRGVYFLSIVRYFFTCSSHTCSSGIFQVVQGSSPFGIHRLLPSPLSWVIHFAGARFIWTAPHSPFSIQVFPTQKLCNKRASIFKSVRYLFSHVRYLFLVGLAVLKSSWIFVRFSCRAFVFTYSGPSELLEGGVATKYSMRGKMKISY